ncbi:agmatinase [Pseudomonas sp. LS1212]|uniref:agmatinase n=1 Tax=Pseudomonas sp. LS1212 TaxID=2972478 RepID=UPI00215C39CA|nr:agmatinase [Pseudomonas sp. LS1212]UVJ42302.1 agmatinase [Pseudomonas sp. LS1212]
MDHVAQNDQALTRSSLYGTAAESTYAGITSFSRRRYSRDLQGVDVVVSGVPFDTATSNRPGARFGPRGIRNASVQSAWERHWPWEFDPFDHLAVIDYGDCAFDYGTPQATPEVIEAHAEHILSAGCAMLTLGGDHFITYPLLKAHARKHGPLSLIHFDAHSDTWADDDNQRIDHGTMFYHAAQQGLVDPSRSVQIGLRTTNDDDQGFAILDARQVHQRGCAAIVESIRQRVGNNPVYLTFDIDCLDPAYAPGTGTPVCGGLTTVQALEIIGGLRGINLVGMDVVEVAPAYDHADITSLAAATLAMEMLCLYAARHKL